MTQARLKKLQKLHDFETRKLDLQKQAVQKIKAQQQVHVEQIESKKNEQTAAIKAAEEVIEYRVATIAFSDHLAKQIRTIQQELNQINQRLDAELETLKNQHSKVKALEKLVERVQQEFWSEVDRRTMLEADERYLQQQYLLDTD